MSKVKELLSKPFKTPFDDVDYTIPNGLSGAAVRDRLLDLQNVYGRIVELTTIADKKAKEQEARWKFSCDLAKIRMQELANESGQKLTADMRESAVRNFPITIPGDEEATTPYKEEMKYIAYNYIAQRGKDRVRELGVALDVGRSVLSWDKEEVNRMEK